MTQSTTRPVAIGELQRAWHAVQAGEFRGRASSRSRVRTEHADPRWAPRERVLPVVGCHPQAGASTLAVAIDTAAAPARVIECSSATATGLATAAIAELGTSAGGWRLGRRGQIEMARGIEVLVTPREVPLPEEAAGAIGLSVLDVGWELGQVMASPAWLREAITAAPTVVVATTATTPGLRRLENALTMLAPARPLVAVLGPARRRWPRHLEASLGPLSAQASSAARVTCIPTDKTLAERGMTGAALPASLHRAAQALLEQIALGLDFTEGTPQ